MRRAKNLFVCLLLSVVAAGCFGSHGDPDPMCALNDAEGTGACRAILGWKLDVTECVAIQGCECVGADCDDVFTSQALCESACLSAGPPPPGAACDPQDIVGVGDCRAIAGWSWNGTACEIVGCSCSGSECDAMFDSIEACQAAFRSCIEEPPPPTCEPEYDGVVPVAPVCRPGADRWYFTADGCVEGCPCIDGTGEYLWPETCPPSYDDRASCEDAHADCPVPGTCDPQRAEGVGDCRALFGWAWSGDACFAISGCECSGADCAALYATPEACAADHVDCDPVEPGPVCVGEVSGPFESCTSGPNVFWFTDRGCEPGCECVPTPTGRCARSYVSIEECLYAHPECVGGECGPGRIGPVLCRGLPRWVWAGTTCVLTAACEGDLYRTEGECQSAHAVCSSARDCDRGHVMCRASEPECPAGMVAAVVGSCWGECVPLDACAPIACAPGEDYRCPGDTACISGMCVLPMR
ncbi:MAG: hypothetical protein AB7S26_02690 [Sandaracinaceae bacterium]